MDDRRYTVQEIDDLRRACELRWLFGASVLKGSGHGSRPYTDDAKTKGVEELVRTHMLAGHTAQDIYDADKGDAQRRG